MKTKTTIRSTRRTPAVVPSFEKESALKVNVAPNKFLLPFALIILLGVVLIVGGKRFKGLIVAGTVNGKPVTRWEVEKAMNDRYAKIVFDDLASNLLVNQLAQKNGVTITADDVTKEISATEARLGGKEALQSTLDRMGYTKARFEAEMRTQVLVQKLSQKLFKIEVTDEEVAKFFNDNKTLFPQKKLDEVKADIKANLVQQKVQQEFSAWFADQKKNAQIQSYL